MIKAKSIAAAAIAAVLATSALPGLASAAPNAAAAQQIADHFSSVRSMSGEFVQFGPSGQQTGGTFYIQRPGKIRFNYEKPSAYKVTADGKMVEIFNSKLWTSDIYPLSKTPLKLLLDDNIDLSGNKVTGVMQEKDQTTIQLADKTLFGSSTISMMFDPKTNDLKQWTIRDAKGKDTTVMIFNVKEGVKLDPGLFTINYRRNSEINHKGSNR